MIEENKDRPSFSGIAKNVIFFRISPSDKSATYFLNDRDQSSDVSSSGGVSTSAGRQPARREDLHENVLTGKEELITIP